MNLIVELRRAIAEALGRMEEIDKLARSESRDLNQEEIVEYDGLRTLIEQKQAAITREEQRQAARASLEPERRAPAHLRIPRGDSEERALAHFVRTGDASHFGDMAERERGGAMALTLRVPTAAEMRAVVDSTMNITTAADGGNMAPTGFVRDVATRKNELMLAPRLGCRLVPGVGTTVNYPYEAADPEDFAATSEQSDAHGNNYERDSGNTALKAFTLAKKTRKIELTEELLEDEDVNVMAYISDRIARQVGQTHNGMLITEVGSNGTALKTYAAVAAIAAGEMEDFLGNDTLGAYLEEDSSSVSWVMRSSTLWNVRSITGNPRLYAETPAGSFDGGLLGYPAYRSNKVAATAASAKDAYFGDWDYVGYREAPEMRFIMDPYSVDGLVVLKYSFRAVYGVLQAGAIGYGVHPAS